MIKSSGLSRGLSGALGRICRFIPFTPNQITVFSVVLAIASFFVYPYNPFYSLGLIVLAFLLDGIDGAVAREKNLVSSRGAFIDGISDRMVEFFLILILLVHIANTAELFISLILILFFGTCMTSFVKAYAEHQGIIGHEQALKLPGLFERAERSILLLLIFILFIYGFSGYAVPLAYLGAVLSTATFLQRLYFVLK